MSHIVRGNRDIITSEYFCVKLRYISREQYMGTILQKGKGEKKKIVSLRSVTALGVVVAQIVAWTFPIPEYEEHSETGVSDTKG